jgi:uncharacterized protein
MAILATAFWRRLDIPGRDAARLKEAEEGFELLGQSVSLDPKGPTALRYVLNLAHDWSTIEGRINGFIGNREIDDHIERTPSGWNFNGRRCAMADIVDLDLGFTPATNTIQLKRVSLEIGETTHFDVAWLEAGDADLQRLPQKYHRVSEVEYAYESPQGNYRATIELDCSGFAAQYPGLWEIERA